MSEHLEEMRAHPANQVHETYVSDAQQRELSLALQAGNKVFKTDGTGDNRWVKPSPSEYLHAADAGWQRGMPRFDHRVDLWATSNVFKDSLTSSASIPFSRKIVADGWHPILEARIKGDGGGLDGKSRDLLSIHETIMRRKLFAGVEWIRAEKRDGRVIWVHEDADDVTYWEYETTEDGFRIKKAIVQGTSRDGYVMRTIYTLTPAGVEWEEYVADKRPDFAWKYYAPRNSDEMVLTFPTLPANKGKYVNLSAVPLAAYCTSWDTPCRSPAPFSDAADLQLRVDEKHSHLEEYRERKSKSPVFLVEEAREDENGMPPRITSTAAGAMLPPGAKGDWKFLDTSHVPQELDAIERSEATIRRKCMDPLRQQYQGEVKAAEVHSHDYRSMSWLDMCAGEDIAVSRRLLMLTAEMETLTNPDPDASLGYTKVQTPEERKSTVDRFEARAKEGLISRKSFLLVAKHVEDDLPDEVWTEILKIEKGMVETWTKASTRVLTLPGEEPDAGAPDEPDQEMAGGEVDEQEEKEE